jgi:hypothetical protein
MLASYERFSDTFASPRIGDTSIDDANRLLSPRSSRRLDCTRPFKDAHD